MEATDLRDLLLGAAGLGAAVLSVRLLVRTLWGDAADLRKRRREQFAVRVGEVVGREVAAQVKPVVDRLDQHETIAQQRWDVVQRQQVAQQAVTTEVLAVLSHHITEEEEAARLETRLHSVVSDVESFQLADPGHASEHA